MQMTKIFDFLPKAETGKRLLGEVGGWNTCSLGKAKALQAKGPVNSSSSRC